MEQLCLVLVLVLLFAYESRSSLVLSTRLNGKAFIFADKIQKLRTDATLGSLERRSMCRIKKLLPNIVIVNCGDDVDSERDFELVFSSLENNIWKNIASYPFEMGDNVDQIVAVSVTKISKLVRKLLENKYKQAHILVFGATERITVGFEIFPCGVLVEHHGPLFACGQVNQNLFDMLELKFKDMKPDNLQVDLLSMFAKNSEVRSLSDISQWVFD